MGRYHDSGANYRPAMVARVDAKTGYLIGEAPYPSRKGRKVVEGPAYRDYIHRLCHASQYCPDPGPGQAFEAPGAVPAWTPKNRVAHQEPEVYAGATSRPRQEAPVMTATAPRNTTPAGNVAPTPNQIAFVRDLLAKVADEGQREDIRTTLNEMYMERSLTKGNISPWIDSLKAIIKGQGTTQTHETFTVPEGRYAVTGEAGQTVFMLVRVKNGRHFVSVYASDVLHPQTWPVSKGLLRKVEAAGVTEAALRFGQELGRCYRCGRTLTDETSRAMGIGPDCAQKG